MKTQKQIISRIKEFEHNDDDFFGVIRSDLLDFLTYENAKSYLKDDVTEEAWNKVRSVWSEENIKAKILDYMPFAFEKANNMRGISANRSIDHMMGYLWILDNKDFYNEIEGIEYEHYGKEKLIAICKHFEFDYKKWDDGVFTNG